MTLSRVTRIITRQFYTWKLGFKIVGDDIKVFYKTRVTLSRWGCSWNVPIKATVAMKLREIGLGRQYMVLGLERIYKVDSAPSPVSSMFWHLKRMWPFQILMIFVGWINLRGRHMCMWGVWEPYVVTLPYWAPKFEWNILRLVVMNKHESACVMLRLDSVLII